MRIGINTLFYIPGEVGGSETYLCETLKAMLATGSDHEYVLFTNREGHPALFSTFGERHNVTLHPFPFNATNRYVRIIREQMQLPFAIRKWKLNVLWSPGYTTPLLAPCRQVLSVLDMQYKTYPQDLSLSARLTTNALVQTGARVAHRVIAISEFAKSEVMRHTGIPGEKVDVTPLAVDADFAARTASRKIVSPHPYILCVANSYPHKNIPALIAAYAEIQRRIPHRLVLVGRPRLGEPAVQAAIGEVPDVSRISRASNLKQADLIDLYQQAALFVFPSLYEGFGLPVLEAMLAGTPVLTTRKASIPEVGGDEVAYFDPEIPGDLAMQIMGALSVRDEDRLARAKARALTFTWQRTATLTLAALRRAAQTRQDDRQPPAPQAP